MKITKRFPFLSRFSFLLATVCFWACADESGPEPFPIGTYFTIDISDLHEKFDSAGNLYVEANIYNVAADTIEEYGFIYTDGLTDENNGNVIVTPQLGVDHAVNPDNLTPTVEEQISFMFYANINPRRQLPIEANTCIVNVVAYITTTSGDTYVSESYRLAAPKVQVSDLFPRYAAPGTIVKGVLNRTLKADSIKNASFSTEADFYKVNISIGDVTVPIIDTDGSNFTFEMPAGIDTETPILLKIGDYETSYEQAFRNSTFRYTYLTEFQREFDRKPLLFALGDAVYFGGGEDENDKALTDFWKYDIVGNQWAQIADYPTDGLGRGMAFVIEGKAYCGTPQKLDRYDPISDQWTRMAKPTTTLQYDNGFGPAAVGIYDGKAYFTNFDPEVEVGVYYNNFHQYDPINDSYESITAYPGEDLHSDYLDRAVAYNNQLHFFPGFQHWAYDMINATWSQLNDFTENGKFIKPFSFNNDLYVLTAFRKDINSYTSQIRFSIFKYNKLEDSWGKEADIPGLESFSNAYILQSGETEVYLCIVAGGNDRVILYKID